MALPVLQGDQQLGAQVPHLQKGKEGVMKFVPPYFYRPDVCQCQLCVEHRAEQEVQRVFVCWRTGRPMYRSASRSRAAQPFTPFNFSQRSSNHATKHRSSRSH
jgi:hypothetical protein